MNPEVIWIGAICTLAIYSILYRENPFFRLFEHIFVGLATGYWVQLIIVQIIVPQWGKPLFVEGKWYWTFAMLIGCMFYFIYSKRYVWIARWAMGLFIGFSAGLGIVAFVAEYIPQIVASFRPIVEWSNGDFHFDSLLVFITLIVVMSYFFFSIEHKNRALSYSAKTGRWLLMIAFGAIFGNTVMARVSLFIDRVQFLLFDWLKLQS
ncbi:MAG: hypothetical protein GTN69_07415 [Armatimonadetes bacterium]|nr:hypothetical protein [Armatimonadota bacterium]NIO75699.1 hypothetical protein [Armatimonadota bacterium]